MSSTSCLEEAIAKQAATIAAAQKATKLKEDLQTLLDVAKKASLAYTRDKYVELLKDWKRQDLEIAELVRKLVCAVPCWRCILDCYVCPLLNELYYAEKSLYDDGRLYGHLHDLNDKQYWYTRDVSAKKRRFDRISAVLQAWSDPAKTISDALNNNRKLTDEASKAIGAEPGKAIFDVFLRLIPVHLAIAPPAESPENTTHIDEAYTKFCDCQKGCPDTACGPDVGERAFRHRLIKPQPYLIDPSSYFNLICCLVEHRYLPARDALSESETKLAAVTEQIKVYEGRISGDWDKVFEAAAKAAIPSVINCCDYVRHDDNGPRSSRSY